MSFDPQFDVKKTGQITATFKLSATPENVAGLVQWIKSRGWRGALILNFAGNGGVNNPVFAETPKALREEKVD